MASGRHRPGDYFDVALQVLEESGFPALTASALCDRMGITRGSFYHHFESFDAFVDGLLEHWEQTYSRDLISLTADVPDLVDKLRRQAELAISLPHGAEAALRAWGTINSHVAEAQRRVDVLRIKELSRSLAEHGIPADLAAVYAAFLLNALIGAQMSGTTREQMRDLYDRLNATLDLAGGLPSASVG